ncbi:hypothetical protein J6R97_04390 [bacterium]|nr:hypothetical protein [bacterium]
MADMENFSEINQNFDTIKTLLNSIRAQGILNTSDVDKLLTGINSKLEKINTEEDIDLIKIFLSELKQNLDERHNVLVSKFGAIESLFSNLLKNSSEMPKSTDIKELFDIVATNLSVFSREVISQKDSITDIALKLDMLRSDDTNKKDIIKNITLLRPDIERLNNGFDSIVISLNENFKTIIKTISTIDKTEYLDNFSSNLKDLETLSNTLLSALQMLDKKTEFVGNSLENLATKDDVIKTGQRLFDLTAQSHELKAIVSDLSSKYLRIDSLAEKIDASVNIIANLKTIIEDGEDKQAKIILDQLKILEDQIQIISSNNKFEEFKISLESVLKNIANNTTILDNKLLTTTKEIESIETLIKSLNINISFNDIISAINKVEEDVKTSINEVSLKIATLQDANVSKIINDINSGAEILGARINQTQSEIAILCEKNFNSVFENVAGLKHLLSQIDENSISANQAIFSSISDRLAVFENSLHISLEAQEKSLSSTSSQLSEQVEHIKNLSSIIDYKLDSTVVKASNIKQELNLLQSGIDKILALDFCNAVKDLRVDLYASKQELTSSLESYSIDSTDKIINDFIEKFESLINRINITENELKKAQAESLIDLKNILDKISNSIIDVLSYVSESKNAENETYNNKISEIAELIKESNMSHIEDVRSIVDIIKIQVDNRLSEFKDDITNGNDSIKNSISKNSEDIRNEIKYSYKKLIEIQDSYQEIKEVINLNDINSSEKLNKIIETAENLKLDYQEKLSSLKTSLLDNITNFKQDFTSENLDKVNNLSLIIENSQNRSTKDIISLIENLRNDIKILSSEDNELKDTILTTILDKFISIEDLFKALNTKTNNATESLVENILNEFTSIKDKLNNFDNNIDEDLTRQLSIIESNFESLVSQISILFERSNTDLTEILNKEFISASEKIQNFMAERLEDYKLKIEDNLDNLSNKTNEQASFIQEKINNLYQSINTLWENQAEINNQELDKIKLDIKSILDENIKLTASDYVALKNKLVEFTQKVESDNQSLISKIEAQFEDIKNNTDEKFELQQNEIVAALEDIKNDNNTKLEVQRNEINSSMETLKNDLDINLNQTNNNINEVLLATKENQVISTEIKNGITELNLAISSNNNLIDSLETLSKNQHQKLSLDNENLTNKTNLIEEASNKALENIEQVKSSINSLANNTTSNTKLINNFETNVTNNFEELKTIINSISENELNILANNIEDLSESLEVGKQQVLKCKDLIIDFSRKELDLMTKNIEEETDIIVRELIEQFDLLKKSQHDEIVNLTSQIEDIINAHIYNNIEDLKSYLDIKTDNSIINSKLDNLKLEVSSIIEDLTKNVNRLLDTNLFTATINDFRATNEIFINTAIDRVNSKLEQFIEENYKFYEDKFTLFDKKFIGTVVDKYEELKAISDDSNNNFVNIQKTLDNVFASFTDVNNSIQGRIDSLAEIINNSTESTNKEMRLLNECFENLRSQISNKSFDEAFQASINKQIASLETLINTQLIHLEDINEICSNSLPDVTELNTLVKHSILDSINKFSNKLDTEITELISNRPSIDEVETSLNSLKTDIITQFINIFNQISFVAEQEEIIDFIQEKHDELISVLSHIVTTTADIKTIKESVFVVDDKIENLRDDIYLINKKISSILSADGDIDYIYSLQEIESDIAGLRLVLNDIKNNSQKENLDDLISSTNEIYNLVESLKIELPSKQDLDGMSENIESISSRTNKLLLASDESYKTLQDNLQEFKLVVNDLDERTRNFAEDTGIHKLDSKLNAINTMMQNGAKTNQVFNRIFEYLAEWVDKAGVQIDTISTKVETLDDIEQIKTMLAELKAGSENNTEAVELIEALGTIFDKQAKKISSLETKLDKVIVETTINNKPLDLSSFENTLNKFLVIMDDKITSQQSKINSLELKLENVMELLGQKETATLTKKVGGMDRQIAKLNKSIEKIASYVVEK